MQMGMAKMKHVRISPRKARLAADLIRGRGVEDAKVQLRNSSLRGGRLLLKALNSAVANAETQANAKREELRVVEVRVDAGPTMKRAKPKNKGGSHPIMKRTSQFTIIVAN
jgi:large subunit ribosomal protein L22